MKISFYRNATYNGVTKIYTPIAYDNIYLAVYESCVTIDMILAINPYHKMLYEYLKRSDQDRIKDFSTSIICVIPMLFDISFSKDVDRAGYNLRILYCSKILKEG